jgi:hypothetical protein
MGLGQSGCMQISRHCMPACNSISQLTIKKGNENSLSACGSRDKKEKSDDTLGQRTAMVHSVSDI